MLQEYTILFAVLLTSACGIMVITLVFRSRQLNALSSRKNLNIEKRILPFIEVHKSLLLEPEEEVNSKLAEELRRKIEGFKTRNQFYRF